MLDLLDEEEIKEIRRKLDPFITEVTKMTGRSSAEYQQFREEMIKWIPQFDKTLRVWNDMLRSLTYIEHEAKADPRAVSTIKLFIYLGLVEMYGVDLLNSLILLLIASGRTLHIEREHGTPRVIHASTLDHLQSTGVTLATKLKFLEENGLSAIARLIDRDLRNDIAHLNFEIEDNGKIRTNHSGNVDIDQKIEKFNRIFRVVMTMMNVDIVLPFKQKLEHNVSGE